MKPVYLLRLYVVLCFAVLSFYAEAQTVYVTRTGKKYHRGDCQYLRQSKIEMKLSEAKKVYDPCSVCKPATAATGTNAEAGSSQVPARNIPAATPSKKTTSSKCTSRTKAGTRCKRTTTSASGKCWQHE